MKSIAFRARISYNSGMHSFVSVWELHVILTLAACGAVLPSAIEAHESIPISGAIPDDEWERLDQFDGITIFNGKYREVH